MVVRSAGIEALLFATSAAAAPQSFAIRPVNVTADGVWHIDPNGQQTRAHCVKFRLPSKVELRWFKNSTEVIDRVWREELDWTQCSASGTLITGDGKRYLWRLDQSGRGDYRHARGFGLSKGTGIAVLRTQVTDRSRPLGHR